ncbi:E3 ubiquitin-protein ligase RNF213-like [Pelobates fuscus]|uniref:E3 ubiquitin-protein ligase RNF213-like n=1 Tax=Pelobates fuscus TaxID=191477 RepID=UPI002FE45081
MVAVLDCCKTTPEDLKSRLSLPEHSHKLHSHLLGLNVVDDTLNHSEQGKGICHLKRPDLWKGVHSSAVPDSLRTCIQNIRILQEGTIQRFVQSLFDNSRPLLNVVCGMPSVQSSITGLAIHLAAVLMTAKCHLLAPLRNLAFVPGRMQNSYLPTMPEDMFENAKNAMKEAVRWYVCPSGHYCAVGECGLPMEMSRCMDCDVVIGGLNHMPHEGFQHMRIAFDRTQTGHVLGDPEYQGFVVAPDREMTIPVFIILRLLTHLAMLLGAEEDGQSLAGIVKPPVQNLGDFLFHHIVKGLDQLRNSLGKSADETTTVVHLIICFLLRSSRQQVPFQFDEIWTLKEARNKWEKAVERMVIAPVLQTLNTEIPEVNKYIRNDDRISSNLIMNIVYEDPLADGSCMTLPQETHVHCSKIWGCRERITVEYLRNVVQQNNGKESVPLLSKFLDKEYELRMVKLLPEILNLQKQLIKMSRNIQETNQQTIQDFLNNINSEGTKHILLKGIEQFILAWNHLKQSLQFNGEIKLSQDTCVDLTMSSDVSFLLPRRHEKGLCATALVNYLITLHNSLVNAIKNFTKEEQRYSVNASDVMDLHVISYDMERDLMPIILSNCQYSMQSGQGTTQEFDLCKIQRQIAGRFLQGKPLITTVGLPTFTLAHDRNYENIFMDLKKSLKQIPQESLPNATIDVISRSLNVYSDVCEALHIVDVTLGFLSTSSETADCLLSMYVENVLHMAEDTDVHILEALTRCHLKHVRAVWQLLTALKSEHLLRLKMDPFTDVDQAYKQPLSQHDEQKLNAFLVRYGPNLFVLELHEMIILKLRKQRSTEDFPPSWPLKDTLLPLLDEKEISFPQLENSFPDEITLAHSTEAWKIAANKAWLRLRK